MVGAKNRFMRLQQKILPLAAVVASRTAFAVALTGMACFAAAFGSARPAHADFAPDEIDFTAPVYDVPSGIHTLGERWSYKFYWNGLPVAHATIEGRQRGEGADRRLLVDVNAGTNAVISLLFRYTMDAEGAIYVEPFRPGTFSLEENEKGKEMATRIEFDEDGTVSAYRRKKGKEKRYEFAAPTTHEFMSTVYLLLNMDYELGETYLVDTLTGVSRFLLTAEAQAVERRNAAGSEVDAYRIFVTTNELTNPDGKRKHFGSDVWVSVDRPRRFLGSRSKTKWGPVTLDLVKIERLPGERPLPEFRQAAGAPVPVADPSAEPAAEVGTSSDSEPPAGAGAPDIKKVEDFNGAAPPAALPPPVAAEPVAGGVAEPSEAAAPEPPSAADSPDAMPISVPSSREAASAETAPPSERARRRPPQRVFGPIGPR
jgi:hypothetical protein